MTKVRLDKFEKRKGGVGRGLILNGMWYLMNSIFMNSSWLPSSFIRIFLLKAFGAKVGRGVVIKPLVNIKYPWKLEIGDHVWIGEGVWIDNLDQVRISDHVCISQGAFLLTGNHNYKSSSFDLITAPIHIGEGAWIGAKSIVCPGVSVGDHAVLTVGSVTSDDLQSSTVYRGNPAMKIRSREIT